MRSRNPGGAAADFLKEHADKMAEAERAMRTALPAAEEIAREIVARPEPESEPEAAEAEPVTIPRVRTNIDEMWRLTQETPKPRRRVPQRRRVRASR